MSELKSGADPADFLDNLNALSYIINNIVRKVNTTEIVKVVAVNTANNTIDVIPIVKNVNIENKPIEESIIYGIRYFQWQYGTNALISEPVVGDIGFIVICKKDISQAENGIIASYREYCLADGIYIGGICGMNAIPTQYIKFDANGISITSPTALDITAPVVNVTASTSATITSPAINLGGTGGKKVALDGDQVKSGNTVVGTIVASSTTTKAV